MGFNENLASSLPFLIPFFFSLILLTAKILKSILSEPDERKRKESPKREEREVKHEEVKEEKEIKEEYVGREIEEEEREVEEREEEEESEEESEEERGGEEEKYDYEDEYDEEKYEYPLEDEYEEEREKGEREESSGEEGEYISMEMLKKMLHQSKQQEQEEEEEVCEPGPLDEATILDIVKRIHSGQIKKIIVFFGESLPRRFFELAEEDFPQGDLLIVMGTSLAVQPFASLIDRPPHKCARLLINREVVGEKKSGGMDAFLAMLMGGPSGGGFRFDAPGNQRDVKFIGDVEDGVRELVRLLGWEKELQQLQERGMGTL